MFNSKHVKFTTSVPFERFLQLKEMIEDRKHCRKIDRQWSYFETSWKPKSCDTCYRFALYEREPKSSM